MSDMVAVRCRACGEVNFVPLDRDFVQVGVPAEQYDAVVRLLARNARRAEPRQIRLSKITDEERERAHLLRAEGMTIREVMVAMGWSLGTTARVLSGVRRGALEEKP